MSRFRTYNPTLTTSHRAVLALPTQAYVPSRGVQRFGKSHTDHCSWFTIPWTYTFSAKEKDSETGFSYFGSRYYNSDLSIWLSVDPQASKYPSLSPYIYCANNPIKLVDPEGEEVWIVGEGAEEFYNQVAEGACALGITTSKDRYGQLHAEYTGEGEISTEGKQFLDAVNNMDVCVTIQAIYDDKIDNIPFCGGAFGGNSVFEEVGVCMADATQFVNPRDLSRMGDYGRFSLHEITEAFEGAVISMGNGYSSGNSMTEGSVYQQAHRAAISQPIHYLDKYYFDERGNQTHQSNAISIGWFLPNSHTKIKEVDF